MGLLKRLRGSKGKTGSGILGQGADAHAARTAASLLRFIPGTAQDVRAYFLGAAILAGGHRGRTSANMIRLLVNRYAGGPARGAGRFSLKVAAPVQYPDVGLYHPRANGRIVENRADALPARGQGRDGRAAR